VKKKIFVLLLICIAMIFAVAGCSEDEPTVEESDDGNEYNGAVTGSAIEVDGGDYGVHGNGEVYDGYRVVVYQNSGQFDIDFTELSTIMASAMFNHIMMRHEEFLGQTIRVRGLYFSMPLGDEILHFTMISEDDVDCCGGMFEFMFNDPSFIFPPDGGVVEVTGTLGTITYNDAEFVVIEADEVRLGS